MKAVDYRQLAGLAMVRLGWTPEQFWAATPSDLFMAVDALRNIARGSVGGGTVSPMGRAELTDLIKRFPDHPVDAQAVNAPYKDHGAQSET